MSCYTIYYENGAKMMRHVTSRDEYLRLRDSAKQKNIVNSVRNGDDKMKHRLLQMNYSCIPNEDGSLKGSTQMTTSVGMDIDHIAKEQMLEVKERILAKKDELGLLMLELSARGEGYHLVFKRKAELSQEDNLRWASELLGVEFDKGAKDITRVFFTTTASPEDLIYLDDELFTTEAIEIEANTNITNNTNVIIEEKKDSVDSCDSCSTKDMCLDYLGIPYDKIIQKWWQMYNDGQEPVKSNRNVLTFELAVNLRHICGFERDMLDKVIPCYDGFSESEKMACIDSALATKMTQMPRRLRDVLTELKKEILRNQNEDENENILMALEEVEQEDELFYYNRIPKSAMPQGISDSIKATGAKMAMPVLAVTCPAIGALATDVKVVVHGKETKLNMHSFVVGDAASCKGDLDGVVEAWMIEETTKNNIYYQ